MLGLHT